MTRLYVPAALGPDRELELPPATAHRMREVLRARVNDSLVLFDGRGGEYSAVIRRMARDGVTVHTGAHRAISCESPLEVTLVQGISRGERMDYTLQKAVELGVTRIIPLASARSQVKLDPARAARRLEHWRGIVVHACEQSGRDRLPELTDIATLENVIATDGASLKLTLSPGAAVALVDSVAGHRAVSLVIGPEGGLDAAEIARLETHGYRPVRLGPRVLRTETAALVALSALQIIAGDLGR